MKRSLIALLFVGSFLFSTPSHAILVDDSGPKLWGFDVGSLLASDPWYGAQATLTFDATDLFGPNETFYIQWLDEISDSFNPSVNYTTSVPLTSFDSLSWAFYDPAYLATDSDIFFAVQMATGDSMEVNSISLTALFGQNDGSNTNLLPQYVKGVAVVPEPSTFLLLGAGLAGLGFVARRRRKE